MLLVVVVVYVEWCDRDARRMVRSNSIKEKEGERRQRDEGWVTISEISRVTNQ